MIKKKKVREEKQTEQHVPPVVKKFPPVANPFVKKKKTGAEKAADRNVAKSEEEHREATTERD